MLTKIFQVPKSSIYTQQKTSPYLMPKETHTSFPGCMCKCEDSHGESNCSKYLTLIGLHCRKGEMGKGVQKKKKKKRKAEEE